MNTKATESIKLDLQLFNDGGEGGGAAAAAGAGEAGVPQAVPESKATAKRNSRNALAAVQYGKQAEQAASVSTEPETETVKAPEKAQEVKTDDPQAREAEFERMIKGDFKDVFTKKFQEQFDGRYKTHKQNEAQLQALQPILEALGSKLGVDPSDVDRLAKAVQEDSSFFEDEAAEKGVTVEQLKYQKKLERDNAAKDAALAEIRNREESNKIYQRLDAESAVCKQMYPGFDFSAEANSPQTGEEFKRIIRAGVGVKTAFEVVHKDELLSGAIQYAIATAQKKTTDTIKARGMRPAENGTSGNAAAMTVKTDPSKYTKADRAEITRRVNRGERIEL